MYFGLMTNIGKKVSPVQAFRLNASNLSVSLKLINNL